MIKQIYKSFFLVGIIILLSACNKHDLSDLEVYIANIRTSNISSIEPIAAYKPIEKYFYNAKKNRDPFIPLKSLMKKSKPKSKPKPKQIQPKPKPKPKVEVKPKIQKATKSKRIIPIKKKSKKCRRNSKIDYTDIKHLKMVGTLQMGRHKWGLVESNGIVLRVKRNDYIGKAKVLRIGKNHITFLRIVPNGKGCWKKVNEKIFINSNYY
jgi:Tfp pilus assembly protein PilP